MKSKTTTETREAVKDIMCYDYLAMAQSNTKELQFLEDKFTDQIMQLIQQEKQNLLEIIDKEVIGEETIEEALAKFNIKRSMGLTITNIEATLEALRYQERDKLRAEQRKKLAEMKEGKGEK